MESLGSSALDFLNYSLLAFPEPSAEQDFQAYEQGHIRYCGLTTSLIPLGAWGALYWRLAFTDQDIALPAWVPGSTIAVALVILAVTLWAPASYCRYWQVWSFLGRILYVPAHPHMLHSFFALSRSAQPQFMHGLVPLQLFTIENPLFLFIAVIVFSSPLRLVPHMLIQLLYLAVQFPLNPTTCTQQLRGSFHERGFQLDPLRLFEAFALRLGRPPSRTLSVEGACIHRLAFWQVQTLVMSTGLLILRECAWRRAFLKTRPDVARHLQMIQAPGLPAGLLEPACEAALDFAITIFLLYLINFVVLDIASVVYGM